MTDRLPMLRPGSSPTASEWNALVALVTSAMGSLSRSPGAAGQGLSAYGTGTGAFQVQDGRIPEIWSKIGAGAGAAYAHSQAIPDGAGGFEDLPASEYLIYGTASAFPAREIRGRTDVPSGTYVRLYPDHNEGAGYLFEWVPPCCFDTTADPGNAYTFREVLSDVETFACCTVTRTVTARTVTVGRNAAGQPVSVTAGTPAETVTSYDLCARIACAAADPLTLAAVADPDNGLYPLEVEFMATPTGGIGPYTYLWDFNDGEDATSTLQNPTHVFEQVGLYLVTVTVTDSCGCTATTVVPVAVGDECNCESCPAQPDSLTFELENGTGDFANANGLWTLYRTGGCTYGWYKDGFTAGASVGSPIWPLTLTAAGGVELRYTDATATCCEGPTDVELDTSTGTGTTPDVVNTTITGGGDCVGCPVPCCDTSVTFTFTVAGVGNGSNTNTGCLEEDPDRTCYCAGFNRAWALEWNGSNWYEEIAEEPGLPTCGYCHQTKRVAMGCNGDDYIEIAFNFGVDTVATYRADLVAPICDGAVVFTLFSDAGACATWPATITVTATP